jgi:putative hydrolase of the HAD superfamily
MDPTALILDYGNVLSRPQRVVSVEAMARDAGASPEDFRRAYRLHRDPYDAGELSAADYWRRVLETLGRRSTTSAALERFIQRDVESWTSYRDDIWVLARTFRTGDRRTAMLTNMPPEILARIRADRRLESWFDVVVASCEIGLIKPDPRVYEVCLSRLGVAADRTIFVDDSIVNIAAAARLGIGTLHFAGEESVRDLQVRLGMP